MAVLNGFYLEAYPVWTRDHLNMVPLDQLGDHLYEDRQASGNPEPISGTPVLNAPISSYARPKQGLIAHSFYDDFYFRVHINPNQISLGNMLSAQTREVEVWNAWPDPQTLGSIGEEATDGIVLTEPVAAPTTFGPLEVRTYNVNVSTNGPPIIDATFTFNFSNDAPTLKITGRRVVLWPFIPQVRVKERLEWATDVIPSFSGEQRLALRPAPRQSFQFEYQLTEEQYTRAKALSFSWSNRVYGAGVWWEATRVGAVALNATSLVFDTSNADYRPNDLVMLWESDTKCLALETTDLTPSGVTLKQPLEMGFTDAYVMPLRFALTLEGSRFTRAAHDIVRARLQFLVTNNTDLGATLNSPYPQHRGVDVFTDPSVVLGDLQDRVTQSVDVFDNGSGPIATEVKRAYPDRTETLSLDALDRAGLWATRRWLHARRGKQRSFWLPSWNTDLVLASDLHATDVSIAVRAMGYPVYYGVTDIMVELLDGSLSFHRVLSGHMDASGDEILSLDSTLGIDASMGEVSRICFMRHVRFDTDSLELNHTYGGRVTVSALVREVPEGS